MKPSKIDNIKIVTIEDELKSSYLSYSMSTILSRAIPYTVDGLKPVHRRILYSMYRSGQDKIFVKSARVVGEVLSRYHPHGDSSTYNSVVKMTRTWDIGIPLITSQGNFGSLADNTYAAQRYTEVKMSEYTKDLFFGIKITPENTIMNKNFDDTLSEPSTLSPVVPSILITPSSGIATPFASSIPSHNIGDVCTWATRAITGHLNKNTITNRYQLPDVYSPLVGGLVTSTEKFKAGIKTGYGGATKLYPRVHMEKGPYGSHYIVLDTLPVGLRIEAVVKAVRAQIKKYSRTPDHPLLGLRDIIDECTMHEVRLIFHVKKQCDPRLVLKELFNKGLITSTISYNMVVVHHKRPIYERKVIEWFKKENGNRSAKDSYKLFKTTMLYRGLSKKEYMQIILNDKGLNPYPSKCGVVDIVYKWLEQRIEFLISDHMMQYHTLKVRHDQLKALLILLPDMKKLIVRILETKNVQTISKYIINKYNLTPEQVSFILSCNLKTFINKGEAMLSELSSINKQMININKFLNDENYRKTYMKNEIKAFSKKYKPGEYNILPMFSACDNGKRWNAKADKLEKQGKLPISTRYIESIFYRYQKENK